MEFKLTEKLKFRPFKRRSLIVDRFECGVKIVIGTPESFEIKEYRLHDFGICHKLWFKLYGKYLRATNTTQKSALAMLCRAEDNGRYKCPDCQFTTTNDLTFTDHLNAEHGYPREMDVLKYHENVEVVKGMSDVKKANSNYLKYL